MQNIEAKLSKFYELNGRRWQIRDPLRRQVTFERCHFAVVTLNVSVKLAK